MTNEQQSRAAFEKHDVWYKEQFWPTHGRGEPYFYPDIEDSRRIWQAVLATRDTAPAMSEDEAVEALKHGFKGWGEFTPNLLAIDIDIDARMWNAYRKLLAAGGIQKPGQDGV